MGALQPLHLVLILVIVLIIFGPGKLTNLGGQLGKGIREMREAAGPAKDEPSPKTPAALTVRTCPSCGRTAAAEAVFCATCGTRITPIN